MNRLQILCLLAMAIACTSKGFFSYEKNTSQHVIERPSGYVSTRFGAKLAATQTDGYDLLAVSAGTGYGTILYRVAEGEKLLTVEDRWGAYLNQDDEETEASELETASALAGLPSFGADQVGCVAVGEPGGDQVTVRCEEGVSIEVIAGEEDSRLGAHLAAVAPLGSEPWLLAVAGESEAKVFSKGSQWTDHTSSALRPVGDDGSERTPITAMDAGRTNDQVVVALSAPDIKEGPLYIHLFVQDAKDSQDFVQVACLERPAEAGFGGALEFGDLDGDGVDELLVSASNEPDRKQAVYVFGIDGLIPEKIDPLDPIAPCVSPTPVSVLVPEDGPIDIDCEVECDFGLTLRVGDIATDDDSPEIAVGAPGARVEGKKAAGAVYLFRGETVMGGGTTLASQVADSHPQGGHRFGGGLVIAPMAGRNELVVGATGAGQAIIAYCSGVGEDLKKGADTPTDGNGKLISTRCRPE